MKEIIIAIVGSGALSALISGLVAFINGRQKSKAGIEKAVNFLLLNSIKDICREHINQGSISSEDLECLNEEYTIYKELGGNGFAETLYTKVKQLPIVEE